jgi:uncharacterized Zn finger protein (UPF0148 family)
MAIICPRCKSPDMQAQLSTYQCLNCGRQTSMQSINETQQQVLQGQDTQE